MGKFTRLTAMGAGLICAVILSSCTQMPTEKRGVSDLRPEISFISPDEGMHWAKVILDDLEMGKIGDFIDGVASLKILPGTHTLQVHKEGQPIFYKKFYIGDGVNRAFTVK